MMAEEWKEIARLIFTGDDFEDGILDVRALTEIQSFRRIVQATAKTLWFAAHPDRRQLPDHFDESIYLGFRGIRPGSAVVPIEARVKNPERLRLWNDQDPVSLAARLTYDTFDAARQQNDLPRRFKRRLLPDYAKLGQELPAGMGFSIAVPHRSPVPVRQAERDWLAARLEQDYEDHLDVAGRVLSVDVEKKTLAIQTDQDRRIEIRYAPDQEQGAIGTLAAYRTAQVRLRGECVRAPSGDLRKVTKMTGLDFFPEGPPQRSSDALSLEDRITEIAKSVPDEEWEKLPKDLSQRVDFYLYGADDS